MTGDLNATIAPNLTLVVVSGVLVACGVALLLERTLSRVLVGIVLLGNGVNLLFLVAGGRAGTPPITGSGDASTMSDPLPQAMVLTAIVITFGMSAFVLALSYRSWQLNGHDEVQDDVEDRRIVRRAELDEASASYDDDTRDDGTGPGGLVSGHAGEDDEDARGKNPRRSGHRPASVHGDSDAPPLSDAVRPDDSEAVGRDD